jgi:hypothetical protein
MLHAVLYGNEEGGHFENAAFFPDLDKAAMVFHECGETTPCGLLSASPTGGLLIYQANKWARSLRMGRRAAAAFLSKVRGAQSKGKE